MAIYINGKKVAGVGMPGKDGKSAYQLAVEGGYQGTEEEFSQILANGGLPSGGTTGQMLYRGESGTEWGDKPVMYVSVTTDSSSSTGLTADKTSEEIYQAFQNGYVVLAVLPEDENIVVPLQSAIEIEQGSYGLIFMSFKESRELIIQIINHSGNGDVVTFSFTKLGANDIAFTPGSTGLTSTNVQDAIEELAAKKPVMYVTFTPGSGDYITPSKSGDEIYQAVQDGYTVFAVFGDGMQTLIPLQRCAPHTAMFFSITSEMVLIAINISETLGIYMTSNLSEAVAPKRVTVTLPASGWSSNTQTVTVQGVKTSGQSVRISPTTKTDADNWVAAGVWCSEPTTANQLVFTCDTAPTENININVELQEVQS